ncbi:unnamed protein product [Meganyctiphanes norvegica]|uniref:BHLH domain-containing protein n=1 Tax=Meganyctiphanes norvegica TaxID=48144 RepID=A0AAV2SDW5_MEGNR
MRVQRCISPIVPLQNLSLLDTGKVQKTQSSSKTDGAQVLQLLERLQNLVPQCPEDSRPVSKLELIQSVIDYIYDLEDALEPESDTPSSDESEDDMAVISDSS